MHPHPLSRRDFLHAGLTGGGAALFAAAGGGAALPGTPEKGGYVDAHVHVWSADTARYKLAPGTAKETVKPASFTPEEFFRHARPSGVDRAVLIQMSYYGPDNSYMLDVMSEHKGSFSGVAVIDEDAEPRAAMLELKKRGVRGFRIYPAGKRPPERWLEGDGMDAMWRCGADEGLAMCLLMNPEQLPAVARQCQRFPKTPVVIDHCARIGTGGEIRDSDLDNLCALARHAHVQVKVSAFYALGKKKAPYLDLEPMLRRLVDAFGSQRLMWGSDCPYQVLGGHTYEDSIALIRDRLGFLSAGDREWILHRSAERAFF